MNHGSELDVGLLFDAAAPVVLDTNNMCGWITAWAIGGAGFAGTATITLETAEPDAIDPCIPDDATWSPIEESMVCGPDGDPVELILTEFELDEDGKPIDGSVNPYFSEHGIKCWVRFKCHCRFVRAVVAGTTAPLAVVAVADAKRG